MSRGSPSQRRMEGGGTLNRSSVVDPETFYQQYEAIKEDYEALRKRFVDLNASHCLSQEEINRLKKLYEDALQETGNAIRERNALQHQCTQVIRQWDSTLTERNEYKDALGKVQQQHEETMKEVNQAMAAKIKYTKDIKRLTEEREAAKIKYTKDIKRLIEERDAANQEYALVMSERDSVHRELEKLTDDLGGSKKQIKNLETLNKELKDKIAACQGEALQEAEVAKRRRDWAFSEREKIVRERESLRTLCDRLRRERDRAVSDLAEALSESEDIRKQKNLASKQLKELRDKVEFDKENHSIFVHQYLSNSSSFSESRDSAIDSDMPSGHYSIKLPNVRGADHGLVLEPGVYISRILPGSPAAKEMNLNVGDRVLFINDAPIDNVQDAILALSEDIDPIVLTLSRSAGHLASPISANNTQNSNNNKNKNQQTQSKASAHASSSSLRSDKSDPNSMLSEGRRHGGGKSASGGLRDIFRVRLPRKKHSSPEEAIALATLDSAIETGGTSRKIRKKRERASSRNSGSENINKNGTWPRVVMSRNSACSYTLPQDVPVGPTSNARGLPDNTSTNHHSRDSSYYGQYAPVTLSNTVCVRRPVSGKERVPVQDMMKWDWACPQPSKSVGTIAMSGGGNNIFGGGPNSMGMSKGLTPSGRPMTMGGLESHGLPAPVQHHRYSFGVFDPNHTLGSSKLKGALERNSVVPTMSDGSSIDFSVKSGNMDLQYYVNKMAKNQNNSSESDHLDKVITPPSLALSNVPVKSSTASNLLGHPSGVSGLSVTSTLDRFQNRYSSPYTGHHHDILIGGGPLSSSNSSGTIPLSLPKHNNNSYSFEPPLYHSHSHGTNDSSTSMSLGSSGHRINFRNSDDLLLQPSYPIESSGTFPRNREPQRIRIPSNQSVTSRNSTEKYEIRNSPVPAFHIQPSQHCWSSRITLQIIDPGDGSSTGGSSDFAKWKKLAPGALRMVRVDRYDKTREFLGINIDHNGGVFVKTVNKNSLASEIGLQIGDQLLEVCGINMRNATQEQAEKILREAGDPLTLLVQFSPDKYYGHEEIYHRASSSDDSHSDGESSSSPDNDDDNHSSTSGSRSGSRSGSPTPCNSPQSTLVRNSKKNSSVHNAHPMAGSSGVANLSKKSGHDSSVNNSLTKNKSSQHQASIQTGGNQSQQSFSLAGPSSSQDRGDRDPPSEQSTLRSTRSSNGTSSVSGADGGGENKMLLQDKTRFLTLQLMKNSSNLGICLVGGNLVGIFVHSVQEKSVAHGAGLRTGDQIIEYNGTDLRHATAEEAAFELAKPLDKVGILVQYHLQRYNEIKDQPGDGFYIRAMFDYPALSNDHHHQGNNTDPQQLTFLKDEILYVDNTMYNGKPGRWRAWKVDPEGHRRVWGVIPSKYKVEEDMLFKRSLGDLDGDRRSSTITRRSFFRRKSHHRSSSRELASFSDFSINSYGDLSGQHGIPMKDEAILPLTSYQRVERLDYMCFLRPVILVGALSDVIAERLIQDFPYQFGRVSLEVMNCTGPMLEEGLAKSIFVDYKRKGSHYECVTMAAIKEVSSKKLYCIMDISTAGVDRLQRAQMYPIVLLIKFKNPKQIREIKDLRCDKITAKVAKELYEHSLKVENEYKHLITACVPGGTNISYLATQVKAAVEKEQLKTLWVPI